MRHLWFSLVLLLSGFAAAQGSTGLRRLSHEEIADLVSDSTLFFSTKGDTVPEYHGVFVDGVAATAYRNWEGQVVEGRLVLMPDRPGLVCYRYTDNQSNCAYFIEDTLTERLYLDFVDTVQQQTIQVSAGDSLDLQRRVQVPYRDPATR